MLSSVNSLKKGTSQMDVLCFKGLLFSVCTDRHPVQTRCICMARIPISHPALATAAPPGGEWEQSLALLDLSCWKIWFEIWGAWAPPVPSAAVHPRASPSSPKTLQVLQLPGVSAFLFHSVIPGGGSCFLSPNPNFFVYKIFVPQL